VIIAGALQGLIGGLGSQFLGGISPSNLSSALGSLGLTLTIPESVAGKGSPGLRKLSRDNDNYLGIFATLGIAAPSPFAPNHTTLSVVNKNVDPAAFRIASVVESNTPAVNIEMSSPLDNGAQAVEFSYRVDNGVWKPFSRERMVTVREDWLRLQGKHTISARSRVVGYPESMDETPSTIDVVIDAEAPVITIAEPRGAMAAIDVQDRVSGGTEPHVRYRLDDGAWSAWKLASEIKSVDVGDAADLTVEARDDEGNVATASQALIRGRGIPSVGGCGCTVVGNGSAPSQSAWFVALGVVGVALRRARRRADKPSEVKPANPKMRATTNVGGRRALRALTGMTFLGVTASIVGCGDDGQVKVNTYTCDAPNCTTLVPGLIGAYTSVAATGKTVWVAGYAEADWSNGYSWGDLVVGQWSDSKVGWSAIDGVPADPPVDPTLYDKNGFRGGRSEERRVGKECSYGCRSRWSPYH